MIGASPKWLAKRSGSIVAEVMITLRSGRRGSSCLTYPRMKSMLRLRSCASSMIRVSYWCSSRSVWISASRMPSVISLTSVSGPTWSVKRTFQPTASPSGVRSSSATRSATVRAAIRRGWVWAIRPFTPRPSSRQIFGIWVVFPEPVSPATITTW